MKGGHNNEVFIILGTSIFADNLLAEDKMNESIETNKYEEVPKIKKEFIKRLNLEVTGEIVIRYDFI
jgi:hypothetical protein